MKKKLFTSIGLMSGTSMDGVDISIIQSDGQYEFRNILDEYFEYDANLQEELIRLRNLVLNQNDLFGVNSNEDFIHLTDLEIYNKLLKNY